MTQYAQYIVILGVIVGMAGAFSYIRETLTGRTKPNKITWLLWSVAPLIAAVAAVSDGVRWSVLPVFASGLGPLLIFIASFVNKEAYWKLEKFDYLCGLCSVLALILWGLTKNPNIAIIFAIVSDGFAAIPTLVKSWKYPETETAAAYTAGLFCVLTTFAAVKIWNFSALAFPVYLTIINSLLVLAVYRKRILKK